MNRLVLPAFAASVAMIRARASVTEVLTCTVLGARGRTPSPPLPRCCSSGPLVADGSAVAGTRNFATETFKDVEGDTIPKEKMLMIDLADGRRVAVRPSGTEPKNKFYMFARRAPAAGQSFSQAELAAIKADVTASLDRLWTWVQADVQQRLV